MAVVVAASPVEASRVEIFKWLHEEVEPDFICGPRGPQPWTEFAVAPHTVATNALLMALSIERGISSETQHRLRTGLLHQQRDPAVVEFFRKRFDSSRDVQAAGFLLDGADREGVRREFNTGHVHLDELIIRNSADDVDWLVAALRTSTKAKALIVDALEKHRTAFTEFALRSREPLLVDRLIGQRIDASDDLVIEGLSVARASMRDYLDDVLATRLMNSKSKNALAKEWLSSNPRVGLTRAPLTAYVLGTWAESTGDIARAKRLYAAGAKATEALLQNLGADDSREDLEGLRIAFTARLQKNIDVNEVASAIAKQFTVRPAQP